MTDRHLPEGKHGLHARVMLLSIHTRWVHTCTCREAGSHAKPDALTVTLYATARHRSQTLAKDRLSDAGEWLAEPAASLAARSRMRTLTVVCALCVLADRAALDVAPS